VANECAQRRNVRLTHPEVTLMLHIYVSLQNAMARLRDEEDGATAVEYGLIVTLIAVAIIVAVQAMGVKLQGTFNNVSSHL
jgi:pilus assembly protein Flp/PilA